MSEKKKIQEPCVQSYCSSGQDEDYIDPRLGQRLREARKEMKWSIKETSERVGCSTTHLTRLELGQRPLKSFKLLMRLADALNIPSDELLALVGQGIQKDDSYLRLALPSISEDYQEKAVTEFAKLISMYGLTPEEIDHLMTQTSAYAEYCSNHRPSATDNQSDPSKGEED